jgi:uncharacterized protein YggE
VVVYGLLDSSAAESEAAKKAFEDARGKAEKVAKLAGEKIGDVSSIRPDGSCSRRCYINGRPAGLPTEYIGIIPDAIEVEKSLSVTLELLK